MLLAANLYKSIDNPAILKTFALYRRNLIYKVKRLSAKPRVYGLANPAAPGSHFLQVWTDADTVPADVYYTITAPPLQVAAFPVDANVNMVPGNTTVDPNDNTWLLNITQGTVKANVYEGDLIVTGLPPGLAFTAAKAPQGNAIVVTVSGKASQPVNAPVGVAITVKGNAVSEPGALDAAPVQVTLMPAPAPGTLPSPIWRYDGPQPPTDPGQYHPFDFDPQTNTLTLYWEQVVDGQTPVTRYQVYRAPDAFNVDWNNPANWGTPIYENPVFLTLNTNGKTYCTCSVAALVYGTDPGREYRYGVQAVSDDGSRTSGISNIPFPFRTPGASLLGLGWFELIPDAFTKGKLAMTVMFTGPVDPATATALANYTVTRDGAAVTLSGPDAGKAIFDPMRNAAIMNTDLDAGATGLLSITAGSITGPPGPNNTPGAPMNTDLAQGHYNVICGQIGEHLVQGGPAGQQGEAVPINPIGGMTSEYLFHFPVGAAIPSGGQITITFPSDYTLDSNVSIADTSMHPFNPNSDINGPAGGTVTLSAISINTSTNQVTLTVSGDVAAGDHLVFVLANIQNPSPASAPGQAYQFSVKAPSTTSTALTLPAFVKVAGQGSIKVSLKDDATKQLFSASATICLGGPGLPPEGISQTGSTGTFTFTGLQTDAGYHVWIAAPPAGFKSPLMDMPVWLAAGEVPVDFYLNNQTAADMKTVTITVNNLPADTGKKAVAFAGGPSYYDESSEPVSVSGTTRTYQLKVRVPGEYMIGVHPYMPPPATGMTTPPPPPEFMPPPPKPYYVTGDLAVTVNLPSQADLAGVTVVLKDSAGNALSQGGVYAYSPTNPDVMGTGGLVDSSGQVTLKLNQPGQGGLPRPARPHQEDKLPLADAHSISW